MRILILGTSNSILRHGYVSGLAAQFPAAEIDNRSVGQAAGIQFACWGNLDFGAYDAVLFDSVPTDEHDSDHLNYDYDVARSLYFELFTTIAGQTRFLNIGLCSRKCLDEPTDVFFLHRDMTELVGGTFVDFRQFLIEHGPGIALRGAPLMNDFYHPNFAVAQEFGRRLAQIIVDAPPPKAGAPTFAANFSHLPASDFGVGEITRKSTRILSREFACLRPGDRIAIDPARRLVGFYLDYADTKGYLALHGPDGLRAKRLTFQTHASRLMMRFVPMKTPMVADLVECIAAPHAYEPSYDALDDAGEAPPDHLSISELAFWSGAMHTLPLARRGLRTGWPEAVVIARPGQHAFDAPTLPVGPGWHPAASRGDGATSRWTGPSHEARLALRLAPGLWRLTLQVFGAATGAALHDMRLRTDAQDWPFICAPQPDGSYLSICDFSLAVAASSLRLAVPDMRNGYGIEVARMLIEQR